jgi:hypothetical protein
MIEADSVHSTPPLSSSSIQSQDSIIRLCPPGDRTDERPTGDAPSQSDDQLDMTWWNGLTKQERAKWSTIAGNTGRAKDAWEAFKRAREADDQLPAAGPSPMTTQTIAPEGARLSPSSPTSASPPGASQTRCGPIEPVAASSTCKPRAGGAVLSRRVLMNVLASAAAVAAAVPVPTPSVAAPLPSDSPAAMLQRAEQLIDILRTKHVADGWKLYEPAAEQTLGFFRRRVAGEPEVDGEFHMDVVEFFGAHGQSLDWVMFGDPSVMICGLAAAQADARGEADQELIELADQYVDVGQKWSDLNRLVDQMDFGVKAKPMPEVLRWREADAALGLPDIEKFDSRDLAWDCEAFVGKLRPEKWISCTRTGGDDDFTMHVRTMAPSVETRARADEIIAAFDKWK